MSKTIIVSNRLPIKISQHGSQFVFSPSEGGLATGLGSIYQEGDSIWIGWPGYTIDPTEEECISDKLESDRLVPVFLTETELKGYYEGFSNEVLWPIFHYISSYAQFDTDNWTTYKSVNEKFFEKILAYVEPGDTIWVHDYQLLLLPGLIRERFEDITIGFFQHIPFPSYEIFRLIPWREELLKGMLGADLLGFHTFDDVRHFISSVTHLLSLHVDANMLRYNERIIAVEPFPMGIDYDKFSNLSTQKVVEEHKEALEEHYGPLKIILTIDRLDYSKGIIQRLRAFEHFLIENPEWHQKVLLYMIVVPSRDNVPEYQRLKDEIDRYVGNINAHFRSVDWYPIAYFYQSFQVEFLSALYNLAETCLVSPLRDGMNLVSKEYVASRNGENGVLILSELAGASKELIDAIIVNPNNIDQVKNAMIESLNMPVEEQYKRMQAMRAMVKKYDIHHWVKMFMIRLNEVKNIQRSMRANQLKNSILNKVIQQYDAAESRLFLLDYDGTLVGFQKQIELAYPDDELINILNMLSRNPNNHIAIISGRKYSTLESWFGEHAFDLIAEHGAWTKEQGGRWIQKPGLSNTWMPKIHKLMDDFSDRTPGAFIEEKTYSLAWHYRKVQKGLGSLRAHELMDNLRYMITPYGLQLLNGDKVVEVKNAEVNKGKATLALLYRRAAEFIFAIGDDYTDEDTFKALPESAISVKVGSDISAARFYVQNYQESRVILKQFALREMNH